MQYLQPQKPPAPDLATQKRWEHSALRKRMLCGDWHEDLINEMQSHFTEDRRAIIGIEDMSSNVFMGVCKALNALYNEAPAVGVVEERANQAESLLAKNGLLNMGGLWPIMQRTMYYTIGMREMFLRIDVHDNRLVFVPVTPDMIYAESNPADPMNPTMIAELKLRQHTQSQKLIWTYDVFDIRDPENPSYRIMEIDKDGSMSNNLTIDYMGTDLDGSLYPYRDKENKPFLPYSCYHAQLIGDKLFDAYTNSEIVSGSLTSACLHTYLVHQMRDCAFPQRYVMGCGIDGGGLYDTDNQARRLAIPTDPSSILVFSPDAEMQGLGQPIIGQFANGADPKSLMETIVQFERKLATAGGIRASSVQKLSGDPRSGYDIAMSRSDQRDAQRRFKPAMEAGDLQTLRKAAMISNKMLGTSFPESGYTISYQTIPLSKEELEAVRKDTIEKQLAGYLTKVDALRVFNPDLSYDEAVEYLKQVRLQNIEFTSPIS